MKNLSLENISWNPEVLTQELRCPSGGEEIDTVSLKYLTTPQWLVHFDEILMHVTILVIS